MHRNHVRGERTQCFDRISAAVEDHVRRVEIDRQVRAVHVDEKVEQGLGRLLSGFERERLFIFRGVIADAAYQPKN